MADDKKQAEEKKEAKKKTAKVSDKLQKIIDSVSELSVLELADLVKALEDKLGVVAMPTAVSPAIGAAAPDEAGPAPVEEKNEFEVVLSASGANKIAVIKAVREINPNLGLKEAKDLVEAAPKTVLEKAKKETASEAKKKLEEAGAQVELK